MLYKATFSDNTDPTSNRHHGFGDSLENPGNTSDAAVIMAHSFEHQLFAAIILNLVTL